MTTTNPATDPVTAARAVATECARAYQDVFAERLAAAYLLGSLAYGGYAPAVSDIDLAVVLTDARDGDSGTFASVGESLRGRSDLHRKLSTFWASLPALRDGRDDGRFPALDRLELADHGVLLLGDDVARQVARPAAEELSLESARFAVTVLATDEVVAEFREPRRLLADPVWFTKAVLFPVRFLYTSVRTAGRAATNDEAVAWYLDRPDPVAGSLVRLAARVRAGHPVHPEQMKPQLAGGLVPLYRHYIDEQTPRLLRAGAPADLVTAFARWRRRLT
ncbi:nucleotidyltransferase domain-containing protein [Kibdelosporangium persicum]|uniref:DNA polymerase n=1 Tax=Kibdelosporangium persicum TaxID=2698649 RepID=A0ABX2F152_9PSEU|nr:nucleotidyltransferase domain-containing protein [Kibdelosporangium persicum]NRN65049.1 DNA polymerase [Kibdelosporangium persicum]